MKSNQRKASQKLAQEVQRRSTGHGEGGAAGLATPRVSRVRAPWQRLRGPGKNSGTSHDVAAGSAGWVREMEMEVVGGAIDLVD